MGAVVQHARRSSTHFCIAFLVSRACSRRSFWLRDCPVHQLVPGETTVQEQRERHHNNGRPVLQVGEQV